MDRIVWLIVLTVVANFLLDFSGVLAGTKGIYGAPSLAGTYQVERATGAVNPDDVELVDPMQASPSDGRSSRIKLFDNIFKAKNQNIFSISFIKCECLCAVLIKCFMLYFTLSQIPISTLQAVNELLQNIGGNFGGASG